MKNRFVSEKILWNVISFITASLSLLVLFARRVRIVAVKPNPPALSHQMHSRQPYGLLCVCALGCGRSKTRLELFQPVNLFTEGVYIFVCISAFVSICVMMHVMFPTKCAYKPRYQINFARTWQAGSFRGSTNACLGLWKCKFLRNTDPPPRPFFLPFPQSQYSCSLFYLICYFSGPWYCKKREKNSCTVRCASVLYTFLILLFQR